MNSAAAKYGSNSANGIDKITAGSGYGSGFQNGYGLPTANAGLW